MIVKVESLVIQIVVLIFFSSHCAALNVNNAIKHLSTGDLLPVQKGVLMDSRKENGHPASIKSETRSIVIIGASYAAGLQLKQIAGRIVINKGIAGEQSFETLARYDKEVIAEKPDAVILWGFINDIFRSEQSTMDATIERIKASYRKMINKARENNIQPIVATEVTMSLKPGFLEWFMSVVSNILGKKSYQDYINSNVMQVNEWLKAYAEKEGVLLLDLQALLTDEGGIMRKKEYSQEDGSHISSSAYQIIAEYIKDRITTMRLWK